jgi:hypothetical protein
MSNMPFSTTAAVNSIIAGTNVNVSGATGNVTVNVDTTMTGLTSVTSTAFVGDITGDVTGNVSGTAATVTGATQAAITSAANLVTVGTISSGTWEGTTVAVNQGGTGQTSYTNGQFLIGNTTGNTLTKSTLTAGSGISVTNGTGTVTIAATGGSGDVVGPSSAIDNSVARFDSTTGKLIQDTSSNFVISDAGAVTAGSWTGTTIAVDQGGSGQTSYTNGQLLIGNTTGNTLTKAALSAGSNVTITNGTGTISIAATDTNTEYTAGDGLGLAGTVFSTDLLSNGGLEIQSAELSVSQGISQYDVPQFAASVVDDDFLRVDGTTVEGRSASEVLSDIGAQAALSFGISSGDVTKCGSGIADDDFLRIDGTTTEGRSASQVLTDIAASPVAGSGSIVTVGTITSGVWNGTDVAAGYIADTAVTPGSYTLASITVDQQGRLTAASTGSSGSGDVVGPGSAIDNSVARFDNTTGKLIQDTGTYFTISDAGAAAGYSVTLDGNKNITPGDGSMIHVDTSTLTDNVTSTSGTATKFASNSFEGQTLAATNASVTTTDAATVYISGPTIAGTNETLTRTHALWVDSGNARFDGSIYSGTTEALNSSGLLTVANQSNITGLGTILGFTSTGIDDNAASTAVTIDGSQNVSMTQKSFHGDITTSVPVSGGQQNWIQSHEASNRGGITMFSTHNSAGGTEVVFAKGRSGSIGSFGIVSDDDTLGTISFCADDGVDMNSTSAQITTCVDGTPGSNDTPGRLEFKTTPDGSSTPVERFRFGSAGQLGIGGATYGTSGQALLSGGASAVPTWGSVPSLSADNVWTGSQRGTPSTITDGTIDLDTANNFLYTPAGADDLEFSNETTGQSGFIKLINPSGYAITPLSEVKKSSTFATDVSTAGTYLVSYFSDGTNVYVSASAALS